MRNLAKQCRYDVMDSQTVDGEAWPDCLSLDLDSFPDTRARKDALVSQSAWLRPDLFFFNAMGTNDMEDVVLWLNGVGSRREMEIGSVIGLPSKSEINSYFMDNRRLA